MIELYANILVCLLPAFLLGLWMGKWIWGTSVPHSKQTLHPSKSKEITSFARPNEIPEAKFGRKDDLTQLPHLSFESAQRLNAYGIYTYEQIGYLSPALLEEMQISVAGLDMEKQLEKWQSAAKRLHQQAYATSL